MKREVLADVAKLAAEVRSVLVATADAAGLPHVAVARLAADWFTRHLAF